jgi:hypothetical protein
MPIVCLGWDTAKVVGELGRGSKDILTKVNSIICVDRSLCLVFQSWSAMDLQLAFSL